MKSFYEQVKLSMLIHIKTSKEFMNLAKAHHIFRLAPPFKYKTPKSLDFKNSGFKMLSTVGARIPNSQNPNVFKVGY